MTGFKRGVAVPPTPVPTPAPKMPGMSAKNADLYMRAATGEMPTPPDFSKPSYAPDRKRLQSFGCVLSDGFELAEFGFELDRGFVAERGMQPASIIDGFEEGADMGSGLVDRRISFAVHFFLLQSAHEALGLGVVIRVAGAAHADPDATLRQLFAIVGAGVLHAPVGVMDEAGLWVSGGQGHVERLDRQARLEMVGERPADHLARKGVENDGQIDELPGQPDISNVGDPDLIEPRRDKIARQIGNDGELVPAVGGVGNERLFAQAEQIVLAHEAQNVLGLTFRPWMRQRSWQTRR